VSYYFDDDQNREVKNKSISNQFSRNADNRGNQPIVDNVVEKNSRPSELNLDLRENLGFQNELLVTLARQLALSMNAMSNELISLKKDLIFQGKEKAKRQAELVIANAQKGRRADELVIANIELLFQSREKAKRAAELVIANIEKTKLSAELVIAKNELLFPNKEKGQIVEKYSRFLLENSPAAIRIASKSTGKVLFANQSFCELTGEPLERAIGIDPRQFYTNQNDYDDILDSLGKGESITNKLVKLDNQKEVKWALASFAVSEFEGQPAYIAWLYDISKLKHLEDQASQMAYYDVLTKLPNRRLLMDRFGQAITSAKRGGHNQALLFVDLDNFKSLNDSHGHAAGDLLLIEVGKRMKACVRQMDTVARIGGDEFVILVGQLEGDEAQSIAQAKGVAEKICLALAELYRIEILDGGAERLNIVHHCTASIGVAVFSGNAVDAEVILNLADAAMYEAKTAGRNQVRFNRSVI